MGNRVVSEIESFPVFFLQKTVKVLSCGSFRHLLILYEIYTLGPLKAGNFTPRKIDDVFGKRLTRCIAFLEH